MSRTSLRRHRSTTWQVVVVVLAVVAALVLISMVVTVKPPARAVPVTLVSADWKPYSSADLPDGGPLAVIASESMRQAGYEPEMRFTTWTLAQESVTEGTAVAVVAMVASDERDDRFLYSQPLVDLEYTLFGTAGERLDAISDRQDLSGLRVARIAGYDYWTELDESGAEFRTYPTAEEAFAALDAGQVDLVAEDARAGRALVDGLRFGGDGSRIQEVLPRTDLTFSTQSLHLLLRDNPEGRAVRDDFDEALESFRATPDYQAAVDALDHARPMVSLQSPDGPVALCDESGEELGLTPSGTAAEVVEWPASPTEPDAPVRVKIIDGPWAGHMATAELTDVVMGDA